MPNRSVLWKRSDGLSVAEFCRKTGANYGTIWNYINDRGYSVDDACKLALIRKGHTSKNFAGKKKLRLYDLLKEYKDHHRRVPTYDEYMDMKENVNYMDAELGTVRKLLKECQVLLFNNCFTFDKDLKDKSIKLINKISGVLGDKINEHDKL